MRYTSLLGAYNKHSKNNQERGGRYVYKDNKSRKFNYGNCSKIVQYSKWCYARC